MLYELRMYQVAEGRMPDCIDRLERHMPPLFAKHGIPTPLGQWTAIAGARMPMYLWMLGWQDMEARNAAFSSLYGDAQWDKVRAETNGEREMVLRYNLVFMYETSASQIIRDLHGNEAGEDTGRLHELNMLEAHPGKQQQIVQTFARVDLPALKRAGARTLGLFDILSGFPGPSFLHFLSWPNAEAREAGLAAYASDPEVIAARAQEVADINTHLLNRRDNWLLKPVPFGIPSVGFARS